MKVVADASGLNIAMQKRQRLRSHRYRPTHKE
jgi:hypothetical protein